MWACAHYFSKPVCVLRVNFALMLACKKYHTHFSATSTKYILFFCLFACQELRGVSSAFSGVNLCVFSRRWQGNIGGKKSLK